VFPGKDKTIRVGRIILILAMCLLAGCKSGPRTVDLYLDAVMLRELGQDTLAIEKLEAIVAADREFAPAYSELGRAYAAVGDLDKAATALRRATQLQPWSFQEHMDLAGVYARMQRFYDAAGAYARAGGLAPESLEAQMGAAQCYLEAGQSVRALMHGEAAAQRDGQSRRVSLLLGRIYEAQEDYDSAIGRYQDLLAADPNDWTAQVALGVAYSKAGRYEEGREVLASAAEHRPQNGATFRHLGYCLIRLGDDAGAAQAYSRALEINPQDWEAHRGLGVVYMVRADETGDAQQRAAAVGHWRRSLAINPDQPERRTLERLILENSEGTDSGQRPGN
jgi:tetratricopeptide (TPR) repeat protein